MELKTGNKKVKIAKEANMRPLVWPINSSRVEIKSIIKQKLKEMWQKQWEEETKYDDGSIRYKGKYEGWDVWEEPRMDKTVILRYRNNMSKSKVR